jgi:eukaryotic-like serine/threonine-protein kinase
VETDTSSNKSLVGTTLDSRYEIESVIGEGGMSTVYKARHLFLNRDVAIKVMQEHLSANSDSKKRFQREAQTAASLSHPNIISVSEFGMSESGQPYMVMDYLPGESLADMLHSRYRLKPDEAIVIFLQICAAIGHAHGKGVLHRDLKPSNVMLYRAGPESATQVKVVDLGLARFLPTNTDKHLSRLTAAGELVGSPFYMSPEQIRDEELDARSDIYSMGCLMYETLTGTRPFNDNNAISVLSMHLYEEPPPFSRVMNDQNMPKRLEAIVFKCLEKSSSKRFQNFATLTAELEKVGTASDTNKTAQQKFTPTPDTSPNKPLRAAVPPTVVPSKAAPAPVIIDDDEDPEKTGTFDMRGQYTLRLKQPEFSKKRKFMDWLRLIAGPVVAAKFKKLMSSFEGKGPEARKQKIEGTRILVAALGDDRDLIAGAEIDASKYELYYNRVELRKSMTAQEFIVLLSTDKFDVVHLHGFYDKECTFRDSTGFALRYSDIKRACDYAQVKLVWLASNNGLEPMKPYLEPENPSFHLILTSARGANFPKFLSSLLSRITRGELLSSAWEAYVPYLQYKGDKTECKFVPGIADIALYP